MRVVFFWALFFFCMGNQNAHSFNKEELSVLIAKKIEKLQITPNDFQKILAYVSNNEFGTDPSGIVSWNEGENFASLGVGHFIWYPEGEPHKFEESFPKFARFLSSRWNTSGLSPRDQSLFQWAKNLIYRPDGSVDWCPWRTRSLFLEWKKNHREEFSSLVAFLRHPRIQLVQAQYLDADFRESLLELVEDIKSQNELDAMEASSGDTVASVKNLVAQNILSILNSKSGFTALLDYINFKGDGTDKKMRYQGLGWGLQQALYYVRASSNSTNTMKSFALATLSRLERRAQLAANPIERTQWIHGWCNRVLGYGFIDADIEIKKMAALKLPNGQLKWPKLKIGDRALRSLF